MTHYRFHMDALDVTTYADDAPHFAYIPYLPPAYDVNAHRCFWLRMRLGWHSSGAKRCAKYLRRGV